MPGPLVSSRVLPIRSETFESPNFVTTASRSTVSTVIPSIAPPPPAGLGVNATTLPSVGRMFSSPGSMSGAGRLRDPAPAAPSTKSGPRILLTLARPGTNTCVSLPSTMLSSMAETVTVWGALQFEVVNVSVVEDRPFTRTCSSKNAKFPPASDPVVRVLTASILMVTSAAGAFVSMTW